MDFRLIILMGVGAATLFLIYWLYFREKTGVHLSPFFLKHAQPKKPQVEKPTLKKKRIPTSGACAKCREKVTMPFRCKFCEGIYCSEHRLPENHDCDAISR